MRSVRNGERRNGIILKVRTVVCFERSMERRGSSFCGLFSCPAGVIL